MRVLRVACALLFLSCSSTSSAPSDPPCVTGLTPSCQGLYDPPAFQTIFDKILHPTCGVGSGTCHTADAAMGGLVLENADDAYARLVDGRRVVAGDPGCSLIMKRLTSSDPSYRMPKGPTPLLPAAQCTIVQWIAAGAKR